MTMLKLIATLISLFMLEAPLPTAASEATEGVIIRQALEKERFGRRRGDVELALGICSPRFVVYDGAGAADMLAWTVKHSTPEAFASSLAEELATMRYDVIRSVTFLKVIENEAIVTVVDSGHAIARESGERQPYRSANLWRFRKQEERWLATSLVADFGDSTLGPFTGLPAGEGAAGVVETLRAEAEGWSDGDAGAIVSNLDEHFTAFDAYDKFGVATWLIIFNNPQGYESWLTRRFDLTDYEVKRKVVHVSVDGDEALAVTSDDVVTSHRLGSATHGENRHVFWTLSRRSGDWKIVDMALHTKHRE